MNRFTLGLAAAAITAALLVPAALAASPALGPWKTVQRDSVTSDTSPYAFASGSGLAGRVTVTASAGLHLNVALRISCSRYGSNSRTVSRNLPATTIVATGQPARFTFGAPTFATAAECYYNTSISPDSGYYAEHYDESQAGTISTSVDVRTKLKHR